MFDAYPENKGQCNQDLAFHCTFSVKMSLIVISISYLCLIEIISSVRLSHEVTYPLMYASAPPLNPFTPFLIITYNTSPHGYH